MTCRRRFLQCTALLGAAPGALLGARAATLPELRLSGPPASVSNPLIHLAALGKSPGLAEQISFTPWRDPDQLRALARPLAKNGYGQYLLGLLNDPVF